MVRDHTKRTGVQPLWVALAIAIFGVLGMLLVDHGPWSKPHLQTADIVYHQTTTEAAREVGARVTPSDPKLAVEPEPPMPKPVEPANPN